MPYVNRAEREKLDYAISALIATLSETADEDTIEGDLNYTISRLAAAVPGASCDNKKGWRYKYINRFIGVLECVKQEYYRRLAGPYEDLAIEKNGDIDTYEDYPISSQVS